MNLYVHLLFVARFPCVRVFIFKARCLRFGGEVMESDSMRTQLTTLAAQLQKAVSLVNPVEQTSKEQRMAFFDRVVRVRPTIHVSFAPIR